MKKVKNEISVFRLSCGRGAILTVVAALFTLLIFQSHALLSQPRRAKNQMLSIKKDGVVTYLVREKHTSHARMSMLIEHRISFASSLRPILSQPFVPLVFSVSTFSETPTLFDPTKLIFVQNEKEWHLRPESLTEMLFAISGEFEEVFLIHSESPQQFVVLLPAWFSMDDVLHMRYDEPGHAGGKATAARKF